MATLMGPRGVKLMDVGPYSAYSCTQCHKSHIKCDKKHPSCTNCEKRNRHCTYSKNEKANAKIKAAPTAKSTASSNKLTNIAQTEKIIESCIPHAELPHLIINEREMELIRLYMVSRHNTFSYESTCQALPIMNVEKTKYIMKYIKEVISTGKAEDELEEEFKEKPTNAELSLIFVTQANSFHRTNNKLMSFHLFDKARTLLLPVMDQVDNDFTVASCYALFSIYLLNEGELKKANFFIRNCRCYFEFNQAKVDKVYYEFLKMLLEVIDYVWNETTTPRDLFTGAIKTYEIYQQMYDNATRANIVRPSRLHLEKTPQLIDDIIHDFFELFRKLPVNLPKTDVDIKMLSFIMSAQASKIQYMNEYGLISTPECLTAANNLSQLVESETFPMTYLMNSICLIEAARVHMQYLLVQETPDLIINIRRDLRGLQIMADRYPLVVQRHGEFINGLQTLVRMYDDR
ncbi:hypothetical protein AKO1_009789 [Acrasis kona]|uniref:Zn(2)-C6 fungal-type domain-containing protein n=1 Tax=Acrasis kona TaxID=1008807 RepID=A0AAW2ZM66_9EUKA